MIIAYFSLGISLDLFRSTGLRPKTQHLDLYDCDTYDN